MRKLLSTITLAAGLLLLGSAIASGEDLYYGGFDGTWDGKLKRYDLDLATHAATPNPGGEWNFRLEIKDVSVRVFIQSNGQWSEVKKGQFRIAAHKTNAIVYATDSANDVYDKTGSGGWVETWNFTLSHKDVDTLYAAWTRSVNNYMRPPWKDKPETSFFVAGFGEIIRQRDAR